MGKIITFVSGKGGTGKTSMCAAVAFAYRGMLCGVEHMGFSAPADTAFLYAVPFGIGIMFCCLLAWVFHKKSKSKRGCM